MGGQKGSYANRERLKELGDIIRIKVALIRRCIHVRENRQDILDMYNAEIFEVNAKISGVMIEYKDAPQKLIDLRRQLVKFRDEQDKITGRVTGRTKLVDKYKKKRAQLAALEKQLSDSGFDAGDIQMIDYEVEGDAEDK
jgi:hypothetical protein